MSNMEAPKWIRAGLSLLGSVQRPRWQKQTTNHGLLPEVGREFNNQAKTPILYPPILLYPYLPIFGNVQVPLAAWWVSSWGLSPSNENPQTQQLFGGYRAHGVISVRGVFVACRRGRKLWGGVEENISWLMEYVDILTCFGWLYLHNRFVLSIWRLRNKHILSIEPAATLMLDALMDTWHLARNPSRSSSG